MLESVRVGSQSYVKGGCFVSGTPVTISSLPYSAERESSLWSETDWLESYSLRPASGRGVGGEGLAAKNHLHHSTSPFSLQTSLHIPIEQIPLGARIPTKNPRPWEYDDTLPEPDQATWAKVSITMHRNDGGIVDAKLIRPRWWIAQHNIVAGKHLPMNIEELQVHGPAIVTAVDECPEIASGVARTSSPSNHTERTSVVTARFITREVNTIARAEIIGPDGTIELIEGTPIHPIWSVDNNDWVPLDELTEGETLQASDGIATVLSLALVTCSLPVYNIEVHGEHVYEVGELGLLVHNSAQDCINALEAGNEHKLITGASEAVLRIVDDTLEVTSPYVQNPSFIEFVSDVRTVAHATGAKVIKMKDVGFGFGTVEGKANLMKSLFERHGTVKKTGTDLLGDLYEIVIRLD
ncbi:polymorphic toxin-type HINT domain-containing protein [Pirellulaceae bacterium SH449]